MAEAVFQAAAPPTVPYAKGYYGVEYRTPLSLHRNVGANTSASRPNDPAWDVWVGGLPFLLASAEERTYARESTQTRRDRFDTSRDPGENSLDSMLWLRSWTSWHLGAGQKQAEPLETNPEVARFRFDRSAGVDIWTPGQITMLRRMESYTSSGVNAVLSVPGVGLLEARNSGVWLNGATQIYNAGGVVKIAASGTHWAGVSATGTMVYGKYDGSGTGTVSGLSGVTLVGFQKNRFWAVDGPDSLREVPIATWTPGTAIKFLGSRKIIDIDSGVAGIYVMTDEGLTNIHVIGADDTGTLTAPTNVATLPRGETGAFLYGYLGRYLAIGSSKGIRIADSGSQQSLPIGPLVIETSGAPADVTADGNFLWVTTVGNDIDTEADGTVMRPGTYRIDLSRTVETNPAYGDTAASRFPYATDQYAPVPGTPVSLTVHSGRLYLALSSGALYRTDPSAYVEFGWLETGDVTFSTGEFKAWESVHSESGGSGTLGAYVNSGNGWNPVVQNLLTVPLGGSASIDSWVNQPSGAIDIRLVLRGDTAGTITPILQSFGLRALPVAKRTRTMRLPLMAFDHEVDRNQTPIGYDGFAFDRVKDLESLEETGKIIQVTDNRTDETLSCQIDRITFEAPTPPDRALKNWGGIVILLLLVV